jgi:hypothetical protein
MSEPLSMEEQAKQVCQHCKAGNKARLRISTGEWVHDFSSMISLGKSISHCLCEAHELRVKPNE